MSSSSKLSIEESPSSSELIREHGEERGEGGEEEELIVGEGIIQQ